jgi:hypothetical protein
MRNTDGKADLGSNGANREPARHHDIGGSARAALDRRVALGAPSIPAPGKGGAERPFCPDAFGSLSSAQPCRALSQRSSRNFTARQFNQYAMTASRAGAGGSKAMRMHPEHGLEALSSATSVPDDVRDMVLHHHEYLDGSGYPHHLMGSEISDLVRIVTISDIFAVLIERRAYRNAMSCRTAYDILLGMGPKLDPDLCREFHFVTELKVS